MTTSLDRIVDVEITRATRVASRRDFGKSLIASYHTVFPERVRLYEDPADMLSDGFLADSAAYKAAVALTSQEGRPNDFKIGRREGIPTQSINVTPGTPATGEVFSFSIAGVTFSVTAGSGDAVGDVVAEFARLMAADVDAVATALASAATALVFTATDFDGVDGGTLSPPRSLDLTFGAHADWVAGTIVVTGTNAEGRVQTENFAIPVGGGSAVQGSKVFATVTQIDVPAMDGANGTLEVGTGIVYGSPSIEITPTDNGTDLDVVATNAGDWYAFANFTTNLAIVDGTALPATGLQADLAAMRAADADWYAFTVADAQSSAQILDAATYAEGQKVVYIPDVVDSDVELPTDTDVHSILRDASRLRTVPFYSRKNGGRFPSAALFGRVLGKDPGSWSPAFKTLSGCVADDLSANALTLIIGSQESPQSGKCGIVYSEVLPDGTNRGTAVTLGGLSAGAEWLDIIQGIDFTQALIQSRTWDVLLNADKVGFTSQGIDRLEGALRGALLTMARAPFGLLVESSISIERVAVEDVSTADKQARHYSGLRFDAQVQGAIHSIRIRGTVRP